MQRTLLWLLIALTGIDVSCQGAQGPTHTFVIASALPFTGDSGSLGFGREHAMLWAVEQVNALGGVAGKQLELQTFDTHSDLVSGYVATGKAFDANPIAIVGPDNPTLFSVVVDQAQTSGVLVVTPSETFVPTDPTLLAADVWLRICPSIETMAGAIAQKAYSDGFRTVLVCTGQDDYGLSYSRNFGRVFQSLGGTADTFPLVSGTDLADQVSNRFTTYKVDSAFLALAPALGAAVTNAMGLEANSENYTTLTGWYFAPSFDNSLFIQNKIPAIAASGVGVSPVLPDASDFATAYAKRWAGEKPNTDEYFYYDAVILLAIAIETAAHNAGGTPTSLQVRDAMKALGSHGGAPIAWNDLQHALQTARAGDDLVYSGVTGAIQFTTTGDRNALTPAFWYFGPQGDTIVHP